MNYECKTINISGDDKVFVRIEAVTGGNPVVRVRYQYDNHLGSACLELNEEAEIISYEEYHPFGTTSYQYKNSELEVNVKRYRYNGKEKDEETGLYYYGARYYAPWLCRFVSCDPLQDKYPNKSPYHYCSNNPVNRIDPDGKDDYYYNQEGEVIRTLENNNSDRHFIIKTSQTTDEMYGSKYHEEKGNVNGISEVEAIMTELGIKVYGDDVVSERIQNNLVEIPMEILQNALDTILDNSEGGISDENNREFMRDFILQFTDYKEGCLIFLF